MSSLGAGRGIEGSVRVVGSVHKRKSSDWMSGRGLMLVSGRTGEAAGVRRKVESHFCSVGG